MRIFGIVIAAVVGFVLLNLVAALMGAGFTIFGAELKGETDKRALHGREKSQIYQAENSIANYEAFYNDCNSVKALTEQVDSMKADLAMREKSYNAKSDPFGHGAAALNRVRTDITGVEAQRTQVAASYNSRSAQQTRTAFKAADLPYTLNAPYSGIQCGEPKEAQRNTRDI